MFENATSLIGLPGAVLAVWMVLIAALFGVTRGLSRALAWTFVAAGLVVPALVLQVWPLTSPNACTESVITAGDSRDGQYAYRIVKNQCHGSSEYTYRVEMGRKKGKTEKAALRTVLRSYGFPRPVAVRQVMHNRFEIQLTSDGRELEPLSILLDPETGEPSYVHRFFQGHSDKSFTVSSLPDPADTPKTTERSQSTAKSMKDKCDEKQRSAQRKFDSRVMSRPDFARRQRGTGGSHSQSRSLHFRLTLRGIFTGG